MKKLIVYFAFVLSLYGGIIDDYYLLKAQSESKKSNYEQSLFLYQKIVVKTDPIDYNIGNLYYKLKKYHKALESYTKIKDQKLLHAKYHNMANCYIKLLEYDNAIEYNKKALEYKNDQKTKYNLQMSQRIQEQFLLQKKKELKKKNTAKMRGSSLLAEKANSFDESSFKDDEIEERENQNFKQKSSLSNGTYISDSQNGNVMISGSIEENKEEVNYSSNKLKLNNYLQQKWDNKLNKIKTYTLLIPLEKGKINDSKIPW